MRRGYCTTVCALIAVLLCEVRVSSAATGKQVDEAVKKAKQWIYSEQRDGNWENVTKPTTNAPSDTSGVQWGGLTAIATYALLAAGEPANDPRLARAIEFLKTADIRGTYALSLRCQVWLLLSHDKEYKPFIRADAQALLGGMYDKDPKPGMFAYAVNGGPQPKGYYDHSVSQYGVLGLWALEQAGADIPFRVWKMIDQSWKADQHLDGGWAYHESLENSRAPVDPSTTAAMTAAGVATLFITQDYLDTDSSNCRANLTDENIQRGLLWMDRHIDAELAQPKAYTMYGLERIGVASGRKYFATHPWYDQGADVLVKAQADKGDWGYLPDTCFSLLFLVRGRAPVMMNKLQYQAAAFDGQTLIEAGWNERPRDLANFARWMGFNLERDLNWQIVNLKVSPDDLHDAPILYIAGSEELRLPDEVVSRLKEFVEGGGMILGNADCGRKQFADSFVKLGQRMFPNYPFRELEPEHVIYTSQQYPAVNWKDRPSVLGVSNGVRELMLLIPHADLGRAWQGRREKGHETAYQLGADIFVYAVDKKNLRFKDEIIAGAFDPAARITQAVKIARLVAGSNWDPEPGGWRRLAGVFRTQAGIDLEAAPVPLEPHALDTFKIAHLTGTSAIQLNDVQRKALADFVGGGGTLIVDAAGGSPAFADSAQAELDRIFGPAAARQLATPLPAVHPIYTMARFPLPEVAYRNFVHKYLDGDIKMPRLRGIAHNGKIGVFFSREDLSGGLVGEPVDGVRGYTPESATAIMRNILLYALGEEN